MQISNGTRLIPRTHPESINDVSCTVVEVFSARTFPIIGRCAFSYWTIVVRSPVWQHCVCIVEINLCIKILA